MGVSVHSHGGPVLCGESWSSETITFCLMWDKEQPEFELDCLWSDRCWVSVLLCHSHVMWLGVIVNRAHCESGSSWIGVIDGGKCSWQWSLCSLLSFWVLLVFPCWSPHSHGGGDRGLCSWEVVRPWGWSVHRWHQWPDHRDLGCPLALNWRTAMLNQEMGTSALVFSCPVARMVRDKHLLLLSHQLVAFW